MKSYLVILIILLYLVGIASAESGTVNIFNTNIKTYSYAQDCTGNGQTTYGSLHFYPAGYSTLTYFNFTPAAMDSWQTASGSSSFVINSGGTGTGYFSWSQYLNKLTWSFSPDTILTGTSVQLTFGDANIASKVPLRSNAAGNQADPSLTKPISLAAGMGNGCDANSQITGSYNADVGYTITNQYNITYPLPNFFSLNVTKTGATVQTQVNVTSQTQIYDVESSYTLNNFLVSQTQKDGIYLNITTSDGAYGFITLNLSGTPGYTTPPQSIVINPITGVGITFDRSTYSIGAIANISWMRTTDTPLLCTDYIRLQSPNSKYDLVSSPSSSGYTKELLSILGAYTVSFERDCLFSGSEILDSNTASVGTSEQTSYIYTPAQVGVGQLFNATYLIGWTKTTGSTVWLRDYSWDATTNSYSLTYQPWALSGAKGVETNQSILVTKTGKHLLKVCDVLLGCKASTTLDAYFNGSEVTTNISLSNITIDKTSYSYGETILVKTAVDNFNWTNKQIVVEYENYGQNIVQNQQYLQSQIESFPLYISDLTFSGSGISRLRLTGKNSTGNYILAYVNFTLSSVDSEGYGLSILGDTNCINNIAQINVIVPSGEVGNLTISADNAKYNKAYTVNGTKTITYKYLIAGTYYITLSVNGEAKRNIIKVISSTGSCAVPIPSTTYKGINGTWTSTNENIKETCLYWDNWVRGIFGTQGVNDVTRILFALGAIVAMMFIGLIASKGNFGVAVILGFFPYAFFTYMTLASPCGQYMPLWINIFIALIIGIKMKWFS